MVNAVIGAEIFSIIMCLIIYIANISISKSKENNVRNISSDWFNAIVSACMFYTICDMTTYIIEVFSSPSKMFIIYNIVMIFSYAGAFVLDLLFLQYINALIGSKNRKLTRNINRISSLSIIFIIATVIQVIANKGFTADTQIGTYGTVIPLYDAMQIIILVLSLAVFLKCSKFFSKQHYCTLLMFLTMPVLSTWLLISFTELSFGYVMISISMLAIFLVIQSERMTLNQKLEVERVTFRDAIMKNASMCVVTDVTEGMIIEDIIDAAGNSVLEALGFSVPAPFDEEAKVFFKNNKVTFLSEDAELCFSCDGLRKMYKNGTTVDSIEIHLESQGNETYLRMMPLLSIDPYTKHLMCTCPCIDITAQKKKELDIQNKLLLSQHKEEQLTVAINSIANIYDTMHLMDIENNMFTEFGAFDEVHNIIHANVNKVENIQYILWAVMKERVLPESQKMIKDFTTFSTLNDRMKGKVEISIDLLNINEEWFRFSFIRVGNIDDVITCVLFTSRNIDKQKREEEKLKKKSIIDELTNCLNRNAYEEALDEIQSNFKDKEFVMISADLNGLKVVNDSLGHAAGDELIIGAADCLKKCFKKYGRVYRIGGDEYAAIINISQDKMPELIEEFKEITQSWSGEIAESLTMSIGYVSSAEFPDESIFELTKIADKRMYEAKSNYYKQKGVDRRGQQRALNAIVHTYTRILKVDLDNDTVEVIRGDMQCDAQTETMGVFSKRASMFIENGNVYSEDIPEFKEHINIDYISRFFKKGETEMYFRYRRKIKGEFKHVLMEIIPTDNYKPDKQEVYLYIKDIEAMK